MMMSIEEYISDKLFDPTLSTSLTKSNMDDHICCISAVGLCHWRFFYLPDLQKVCSIPYTNNIIAEVTY